LDANIWSAVQSISAVLTLGLLVYGLKLQKDAARSQRDAAEATREAARWQKDAAEAARATVESAERAQRTTSRPIIRLSLEWHRVLAANNSPIDFVIRVKNVGHGTAVVEQVQIFTWGNLNVSYARTDVGHHPSLEEQFDSDVFLRLLGMRMSALPATLEISPLTEATRAIDVGGETRHDI
jgi:hypothetical protein